MPEAVPKGSVCAPDSVQWVIVSAFKCDFVLSFEAAACTVGINAVATCLRVSTPSPSGPSREGKL
jgi:hypothetical protein